MFVLYFLNKSKQCRYFCSFGFVSVESPWYDCSEIKSAQKYNTRQEAEAMRDSLNEIIKRNKWYGKYRLAKC